MSAILADSGHKSGGDSFNIFIRSVALVNIQHLSIDVSFTL